MERDPVTMAMALQRLLDQQARDVLAAWAVVGPLVDEWEEHVRVLCRLSGVGPVEIADVVELLIECGAVVDGGISEVARGLI